MATRVAINGFGRIGRIVFQAIVDRGEPLEVRAVNDIGAVTDLAHLLKYDSVHGVWPHSVEGREDRLVVDGKEYPCLKVADPSQAPWHDLGVEVVLETSGRFVDRASCQKHVASGVNEEQYDPRNHHIVSNASCTTNCLAPVVRVLHDRFEVEHGLMTTIHSYTADQRLVDAIHKDLRRARAAALSMIPTTTGAAVAVAEVIPELKGKLDGLAIRVPTPNVSLVDFVCRVGREVTKDAVNGALEEAANGPLQGIIRYVREPLVSIDFNHTPYSSSVDAALTTVIDGRLVKVLSWYDNEYGYSNRLIDLAVLVGKYLER
jgi:glyceraldehyde 3-phosphate dehydrogenase